MKRTLALAALLAFSAKAAPSYSVKLRVKPALAGTQATLVHEKGRQYGSCTMMLLNGLLFCKVPAGKYLLSVVPIDSSYTAVRKAPITVKTNASFTLDLPKKSK